MRKVAVVLAVAASLAVAGCSGSGRTHQSGSALWTDTTGGDVSLMPSGFRNVASKCVKVGGEWFAVFSASNGGSGDNLSGAVAAQPDPGCANGLGRPR